MVLVVVRDYLVDHIEITLPDIVQPIHELLVFGFGSHGIQPYPIGDGRPYGRRNFSSSGASTIGEDHERCTLARTRPHAGYSFSRRHKSRSNVPARDPRSCSCTGWPAITRAGSQTTCGLPWQQTYRYTPSTGADAAKAVMPMNTTRNGRSRMSRRSSIRSMHRWRYSGILSGPRSRSWPRFRPRTSGNKSSMNPIFPGISRAPSVLRGRLRAMPGLVDEGKYEETLELFLRNVIELPPDQIDMLRSDPSWDNRVAAAHTFPPGESVMGEGGHRRAR